MLTKKHVKVKLIQDKKSIVFFYKYINFYEMKEYFKKTYGSIKNINKFAAL